jgi:hypothetical protein
LELDLREKEGEIIELLSRCAALEDATAAAVVRNEHSGDGGDAAKRAKQLRAQLDMLRDTFRRTKDAVFKGSAKTPEHKGRNLKCNNMISS